MVPPIPVPAAQPKVVPVAKAKAMPKAAVAEPTQQDAPANAEIPPIPNKTKGELFDFSIEVPQFVPHTNLLNTHKALRGYLTTKGYPTDPLAPRDTTANLALQAAHLAAQANLLQAQQDAAPPAVIQGWEAHLASLQEQLGPSTAKALLVDTVALDDFQLAQSKCEKWLLASSEASLTAMRTCATQIMALHDRVKDQRNTAKIHFLAMSADTALARQHLALPSAEQAAANEAAARSTKTAKAAELGATLLASREEIWANILTSQSFIDAACGLMQAPTQEGLIELCKTVSKRALTEVVSTVNLAPPTPQATVPCPTQVASQAAAASVSPPAPTTPVPPAFPTAPAVAAIPALAATLAVAASVAIPAQASTTRELASPHPSPTLFASSPMVLDGDMDLDQILPIPLTDADMICIGAPPFTPSGINAEHLYLFDDQAHILS